MNKATEIWNKSYQNTMSPWGQKPDYALIRYARIIPNGAVLDLGIGDGRNGLFYAQLGYKVEGVDVSPVAVKRCRKTAQSAKLKIKVEVKNIKNINIRKSRYSLIIAAWILNFFKKVEINSIVKKIKSGVKKNGFIYIGVFSTDDPGFKRARKNLKMVEANTFISRKRNTYIHGFTKQEVLSYFSDFKTIYCTEGIELDVDHKKPHYHGAIIYLGQRIK